MCRFCKNDVERIINFPLFCDDINDERELINKRVL